MKRRFPLYILVLFIANSLQAQTSLLTERLGGALSPSESRYNNLSTDMDVRKLCQMYSNPSFYGAVQNHNTLFYNSNYHSYVSTAYSSGKLDGDFLPYEGNAFEDFRLLGHGEYSLHSVGILFGSIQYARGKHEGIGWNAMRYPELYLPYVSTDSIGGDFHYEDYQIEGGYTFNLAGWEFGVQGSFHGEQAYRKTDPRALNNTTWLKANIGVTRLYRDHLFMLNGYVGKNKQHMSLRYWRPGQQDRFFVCYGFGLYDNRESAVLFGYSRMYYIKEKGFRLTYQSPAKYPIILYASLGVDYDHMETEESDIKDLYYSRTSSLSPSIKIDWKASDFITLSLWLENNTDKRKGYENIFEQYLSDVQNNVYDFRKIDTQQQYIHNQSKNLAQLRLLWDVNSIHTIGIQGGISYFLREEKYKENGYQVKNEAMSPHGGIDYKLKKQKSELEMAFLYSKRISIDNKYDVVLKNQTIQHLDFQQTFAPYAYYNCNYTSIQVNASYIHHFSKLGIGINIRFMSVSGERNDDAIYNQQIGFNSSAPMITNTPNKHKEHWGSSSLFFVF